jgi:signal transduction histidine kinase
MVWKLILVPELVSAIVRKGIDRMGGCVGVESQLGQKSSFWIELRNGD